MQINLSGYYRDAVSPFCSFPAKIYIGVTHMGVNNEAAHVASVVCTQISL